MRGEINKHTHTHKRYWILSVWLIAHFRQNNYSLHLCICFFLHSFRSCTISYDLIGICMRNIGEFLHMFMLTYCSNKWWMAAKRCNNSFSLFFTTFSIEFVELVVTPLFCLRSLLSMCINMHFFLAVSNLSFISSILLFFSLFCNSKKNQMVAWKCGRGQMVEHIWMDNFNMIICQRCHDPVPSRQYQTELYQIIFDIVMGFCHADQVFTKTPIFHQIIQNHCHDGNQSYGCDLM